jgi:predicted Zn-dependent protease
MARVRSLLASAVIISSFLLPPGSANANLETWRWTSSTVCVVNNTGSSLWPLATVVQRYNRAADLAVISRRDCAPYRQKVWLSRYSRADGRCGVTTIWRNQNHRLLYARIQLNTYYGSCLATRTRRAHVLSHELGHAVGLAHTARRDSVMNASTWSYDHIPYPSGYDYAEIERRYPW